MEGRSAENVGRIQKSSSTASRDPGSAIRLLQKALYNLREGSKRKLVFQGGLDLGIEAAMLGVPGFDREEQ